jgi:hypothetical protein
VVETEQIVMSEKARGKQPMPPPVKPPSFTSIRLTNDSDSDLELEILDDQSLMSTNVSVQTPRTPVKLYKKIREVHAMRERELEERRKQNVTPRELNSMLQKRIVQQLAEQRQEEEEKARQLGVWQAPTNGVSLLARERERRKIARDLAQHRDDIDAEDEDDIIYSGEDEEDDDEHIEELSGEENESSTADDSIDADMEEAERQMERLACDEPSLPATPEQHVVQTPSVLPASDSIDAAAHVSASLEEDHSVVVAPEPDVEFNDDADQDEDSVIARRPRTTLKKRPIISDNSDDETSGAQQEMTTQNPVSNNNDNDTVTNSAAETATDTTKTGSKRLMNRKALFIEHQRAARLLAKRQAELLDAEAEEEEDEWAGFLGQNEPTRRNDEYDIDDRYMADLDIVVDDIDPDEQINEEEVAALHR